MSSPLRAFSCTVAGEPDDPGTIVNARSRGRAKSQYLSILDMDGIEYTDVRARVSGSLPVTTQRFIENAKYREIPFARVGMRVQVGNEKGAITGHNSSANLDVLFDEDSKYPDMTLNCHPNWDIKYFDDDGDIIKVWPGNRPKDES